MALPAWARHWKWWGTGLIATALLIRGTWWATHGTLWLVNGLDVPVRVTVAGRTEALAPSGKASFRLRSGSYPLQMVTEDGEGREELLASVPSWGDTAVYSAGGAGPLVLERVFFSSGGNAPEPQYEILCGQRLILRDADYYFRSPPASVRPTRRDRTASRTVLRMLDGGWRTCVGLLVGRGQEQTAADLLPPIRALTPSDDLVSVEAQLRWMAGDGAGAVSVLRDAAAESGSRLLHRSYQHFGRMLGKRQELLREYGERRAREPSNPDWGFLEARLLPPAERVEAYRALLAQRPDDQDVRLALAWVLGGVGRFGEALDALEPLGDGAALAPDDRQRLLHRRVWALAATGRAEGAIALLRARTQEGAAELRLLMQQGLLAARLGRSDLEPEPKVIEGTGDERERHWRRLLYVSQVRPEQLGKAELGKAKLAGLYEGIPRILVEGASDPRAALILTRRLRGQEAELPEQMALVLLGEAWRTDDEAAANVLLRALVRSGADFGSLKAWVLEGKPTEELEELGEDRVAMHLARARQLRAQGDNEAAAAEERLVRQHDVFAGAATRALKSWPSSAPAPAGDVRLASGKTPPKKAAPPPEPKVPQYRLVREEGITLEREP